MTISSKNQNMRSEEGLEVRDSVVSRQRSAGDFLKVIINQITDTFEAQTNMKIKKYLG